jgi:hypothetical protein
MLFLSSYTGATSAILIADNQRRATINSLQDVAYTAGGKICMLQAMEKSFLLKFPEFEGRVMASGTATTVLQAIDDGDCIAAAIGADYWNSALTGKVPTTLNHGKTPDKNHCDKTAVGVPVMSIPCGMPVHERYREALSYLIALKVEAEEYRSFRADAIQKFIGPNTYLYRAGQVDCQRGID